MPIIPRQSAAPVSLAPSTPPVAAPPPPAPVAPPVAATVVAPIPPPANVPQPAVAVPAAVQQALVVSAQQHAMSLGAPRPALPSYIEATPEGEVAAGFENAGDVGLMVPMLSLAQPLTPEVAERKGLEAGDVFRTDDKSKPLFRAGQAATFLPFFHYREWIEWQHRSLGGGMVGRSKDPKGKLAQRAAAEMLARKPGAEKPSAQQQPSSVVESHVFLGVFRDGNGGFEGPFALTLSRTKHKKGRLLLTLADSLRDAAGRKVPLYAGAYDVSPVLEKNKQGQPYWNYDFKPAGVVSEGEFKMLKDSYKMAAETFDQLQLQYEAEHDDTAPAAPAAGAKADTF